MHHRFPIKNFGNDGVNEIQSVNRAMKDAYILLPIVFQINKFHLYNGYDPFKGWYP